MRLFCRFKLPNENADVPSVQKMHKIAVKNVLEDRAILMIGVIGRSEEDMKWLQSKVDCLDKSYELQR